MDKITEQQEQEIISIFEKYNVSKVNIKRFKLVVYSITFCHGYISSLFMSNIITIECYDEIINTLSQYYTKKW